MVREAVEAGEIGTKRIEHAGRVRATGNRKQTLPSV